VAHNPGPTWTNGYQGKLVTPRGSLPTAMWCEIEGSNSKQDLTDKPPVTNVISHAILASLDYPV